MLSVCAELTPFPPPPPSSFLPARTPREKPPRPANLLTGYFSLLRDFSFWRQRATRNALVHEGMSSPGKESALNGGVFVGKATGIVTTSRITHATPAALYAHTPSRYWEDDGKVPPVSRKSCKDITRQLVEDDPGRNINVSVYVLFLQPLLPEPVQPDGSMRNWPMQIQQIKTRQV